VRGHVPAVGGSPLRIAGTEACLASRASMTSLSFMDSPGDDEAWWFVIRKRNCGGPGSYDSGDVVQAGTRDACIDAAPSACSSRRAPDPDTRALARSRSDTSLVIARYVDGRSIR